MNRLMNYNGAGEKQSDGSLWDAYNENSASKLSPPSQNTPLNSKKNNNREIEGEGKEY